MKIGILRIIHGLFALYFLACLVYMYYGAFTSTFGLPLIIAVASLAVEGFVVFILNNGNCPLIHIQKKIGDNTPFFELFFQPTTAKKAIPFFAILTWVGVSCLVISIINYYFLR